MAIRIHVDVPWNKRNGAPTCNTVQMECISLVELPAMNSQETTWQCPHCRSLVITTAKKEEVNS